MLLVIRRGRGCCHLLPSWPFWGRAHSVAMARHSSSTPSSFSHQAMPWGMLAGAQQKCYVSLQTGCSDAQSHGQPWSSGSDCSSSSRCSSVMAAQDLTFTLDPHRTQQWDLLACSSSSRCSSNSRSSSSSRWQQHSANRPLQRSSWTGFASLTTSPQIGQLRWNHTARQPADSNQQQQQQQAVASDQPQQPSPQPEGAGLTAEQIEKDLQRLARDVFHRGQVLSGGRYQLVHKINITEGLAEGRFTTIWHAKDLSNNSNVILKCMEAGDNTSYTAGMREAALHATVGRHDNIVGLLDAFEHRSSSGRHPVMVLQSCGATLLNVAGLYFSHAALARNLSGNDKVVAPNKVGSTRPAGICDNPQALRRLASDMLCALEHIHKRGLAHMDLSTDNVLLDKKFVSEAEVHAQTLFPKYNIFKNWHTRWQLARYAALSDKQPEKAQAIAASLTQQMQDATAARPEHTEGTLAKACWRLTDFGRAVPFEGLMPGLPKGAAVEGQAQNLLRTAPQRYNQDGVVVFSDPAYQPPEEILGMPYISPNYDMWKLGCLLYEAATDKKLFGNLSIGRAVLEKFNRKGFSDQHLLLDNMVSTLGHIPRELARKSPLHNEFFIGKGSVALADTLRIHSAGLRCTASEHPLEYLLAKHTVLPDEEVHEFASFLGQLLRWEPSERPSAAAMLKHPWLEPLRVPRD